MVHITEADVRRLLPMSDAVPLMRRVFEALGKGEAQNQVRRRLIVPGGAVLHALAGAYGRYFGTKVYSSYPHREPVFRVLLYSAENADLLALVEANHLGQIRTGAASGFATDLLARPGAETLGIIGSGFQAKTQLAAMLAVRKFRTVRVWSRSPEKRSAFARECSEAFGTKIDAVETAEQAVRGADVIVTITNAKEPVLDAAWVEPHAHVNAAGSNQAKRREIPGELVKAASLIAVDSMEAARAEAGDLLLALDEAGWSDPKLVELGVLAAGKKTVERGRGPTIFKSNGLGVEDVAAAGLIYERYS